MSLNMKLSIAFIAVLGVAMALPAPQSIGVVPILTRSEIRDDFNQFALSYSSSNGIAVAQQGALKAVQTPNGLDNVLVQQGSYAYTGPDGRLYKLSYIADENGFRPTADFLPTPPTVAVV